jgi:uncharacterized protein (DUF1778 family)
MTARATKRFNLRATPEQAARIRAAVEIGNERSLTDYILSSALIIADQRLMDRTGLPARAALTTPFSGRWKSHQSLSVPEETRDTSACLDDSR